MRHGILFGCTRWRVCLEVTPKLLASAFRRGLWPQWFHYHWLPIDGLQQMASGSNVFRHVIARGISLRGNFQEAFLSVDFQTLNATITLGVKGVGQT